MKQKALGIIEERGMKEYFKDGKMDSVLEEMDELISGLRDTWIFMGGTREAENGYSRILREAPKEYVKQCLEYANDYLSKRSKATEKKGEFRKYNGEGIYIGTAPEQRSDGKNPTSDPDESSSNWIHDNIFDTQGNECVDIKEGSSGNIVENNKCTGQKDAESGGLDARGSNNIFRFNEVYANVGAGVRLGGDASQDGIDNDVYQNTIKDNKNGGIKFQRKPQGKICGNTMSGNTSGNAVGTFASSFTPTKACP